jgi:hypothetical protein
MEFARVLMFESLVFFGIRHEIYKEDGAAYGFYKVPRMGSVLVGICFVLMSVTPPVGDISSWTSILSISCPR